MRAAAMLRAPTRQSRSRGWRRSGPGGSGAISAPPLSSVEMPDDVLVDRKEARPEDQQDDDREEECVLGGGVKVGGVGGKGRLEGVAVGGQEGHDHVPCEQQADDARAQAEDQEDAADELQAGDEI